MNRILIIIPIVILIIGIGSYFGMQSDENIEISQIEQRTELMESPVLIQTNVKSLFKVMAYENDFEMIDGEKIWRNVYYELDESKLDTYQDLKNDKKSAVVFPIFTAAAYSEPGFYTFYRGECDGEFHGMLFRDEDCLTIKINEEYSPSFTSSGTVYRF